MCRLSVLLPQAYLCDRKNRLAGRGRNLENCACCVRWLDTAVNHCRLPPGLGKRLCKEDISPPINYGGHAELCWNIARKHHDKVFKYFFLEQFVMAWWKDFHLTCNNIIVWRSSETDCICHLHFLSHTWDLTRIVKKIKRFESAVCE